MSVINNKTTTTKVKFYFINQMKMIPQKDILISAPIIFNFFFFRNITKNYNTHHKKNNNKQQQQQHIFSINIILIIPFIHHHQSSYSYPLFSLYLLFIWYLMIIPPPASFTKLSKHKKQDLWATYCSTCVKSLVGNVCLFSCSTYSP